MRLLCRLEREIGISSYRDARGRPKTVRYWEMAPVGGVLAPANEVDDARWVALADVARGAHVPTGSRPSRAIRKRSDEAPPVPWMTTSIPSSALPVVASR